MDRYPFSADEPAMQFQFRSMNRNENRGTTLFLAYAVEVLLRLPAFILVELFFRYKNMKFEELTETMINQTSFANTSYVDMAAILDFIHRRNYDHSASLILSNSVLVLSGLLLMLPTHRVMRLYAHFISLCLFAFSWYMSISYVRLEQSLNEVVQFDELKKLERPGFHFLAQILLGVMQSFLLRIEQESYRFALPAFALPIFVRMFGAELKHLMTVHNGCCGFVMVCICMYVLNCVPHMCQAMRILMLQLRAAFTIRGVVGGFLSIWRRLKVSQLLSFAWLVMFLCEAYVEMHTKKRDWIELGQIILSSMANCTKTPVSLLALSLTVSYISKWITNLAQLFLGGPREHVHVIEYAGYTEGIVMIVMSWYSGVLDAEMGRRSLLIGIIHFNVLSALQSSMLELLEPNFLALVSFPLPRTRHVRCLSFAIFLASSSAFLAYAIPFFIQLELWCAILIANCLLTTVRTVSLTLRYTVSTIESRRVEPWNNADSVMYGIGLSTNGVELLIALIVLVFGLHETFVGRWNWVSLAVLFGHAIVNVYKRLHRLIATVYSRKVALQSISHLPKATASHISAKNDVCAICFSEMSDEAVITPCKHIFHTACLRKWLAVKQVCPLCYSQVRSPMNQPVEAASSSSEMPPNSGLNQMPEGGLHHRRGSVAPPDPPSARQHHSIDSARDMWPLVPDGLYDGSDSDSNSESIDPRSEYSVANSEFTDLE
ncbi:hypothetical protein WR25_04564 [Diploscapter pachys]|uniref:RING-type domain-containing protein n=1 Tax=Diploscapter pachys TaxID=2018661 RepID=A0A2A2JFY0_9BILA|nr:hypothetical protein WR25_04564 [Diploscapter pachys]